MAVIGNITELLEPKYRDLAYLLNEDEDFLNLYRDGKQIATFSSHRNSLDKVNEYIEMHSKGKAE